MKRATGSKSGEAGFLFYESTNPNGIDSPVGNFVTLETLLKTAPVLNIEGEEIYTNENLGGSYVNKILN